MFHLKQLCLLSAISTPKTKSCFNLPPLRGVTRQPWADIQEPGPPSLPQEFNAWQERVLRSSGSQGRTGTRRISTIRARNRQIRLRDSVRTLAIQAFAEARPPA